MSFAWVSQAAAFANRETRRAARNTWLLVFTVLALVGGALIFRFAAAGSAGFLFLQIQLFLLPLFAVLMGCSSAHEDLEEMPVLFSQPIFRGAFLCGKWLALTAVLAVVTALAMLPSMLAGRGGGALVLLWAHGVALSGVFVALGLVLGVSWQDRARGLIAALVAWLALVFGWDALAWLAVQSGLAEKWPSVWVAALFANPPGIFRVGALLALEDIPFHAPTSQPGIAWMLEHSRLLTPAICGAWILLALGAGSLRLRRGLDAGGPCPHLRRLMAKRNPTPDSQEAPPLNPSLRPDHTP